MAEPLADQILRKIGEARELYHRLILIGVDLDLRIARQHQSRAISPDAGPDRTPTGSVATATFARCLCVERQASDVLLFDNIEIVFDVRLKQHPLRLLKELSRNKTIVAAWSGSAMGSIVGHFTFGKK